MRAMIETKKDFYESEDGWKLFCEWSDTQQSVARWVLYEHNSILAMRGNRYSIAKEFNLELVSL